MKKTRTAIIGAGAMGLACAYDLLKAGHEVHIFEDDDRVGGMSASFDFEGLNIERYYHFVCGPDYPLFEMMKELSIADKLKWNETKMGFFYNGKLYKWGNPLYLLTFPEADMITKLRYGLHVFLASKRSDWKNLDGVNALSWIRNFVGVKGYNIFWKPLFDLKFYELANNISAAWIWTRIKRVALSRKNIFTEKMGYIEGGSDTLFQALVQEIEKMGGKIHLKNRVKKIAIKDKELQVLEYDGGIERYDNVVSTIPLPLVPTIMPELPASLIKQYQDVRNIGVVCVVFKLKNRFTENFWLNINDSTIEIPGMIEYSNLNPMQPNILYIPFYLDKSHPKYNRSDESFIEEVLEYAKKINPAFSSDWVLGHKVHRYEYAQPVCTPNYLNNIPDIQTEINGLYIGDTSYYYPEDRSISESIRLGREMAGAVVQNKK